MTAVNIMGIAGSLIVLIALFEMLRRHRLREKYAVIWFVIAGFALLMAAGALWRIVPRTRA